VRIKKDNKTQKWEEGERSTESRKTPMEKVVKNRTRTQKGGNGLLENGTKGDPEVKKHLRGGSHFFTTRTRKARERKESRWREEEQKGFSSNRGVARREKKKIQVHRCKHSWPRKRKKGEKNHKNEQTRKGGRKKNPKRSKEKKKKSKKMGNQGPSENRQQKERKSLKCETGNREKEVNTQGMVLPKKKKNIVWLGGGAPRAAATPQTKSKKKGPETGKGRTLRRKKKKKGPKDCRDEALEPEGGGRGGAKRGRCAASTAKD